MQLIPARSNGNPPATISSRTNEAEIHRVSLRGRGKSSWNWPKHSINFGLRDAAQKPTRETLLGMPAAGDWLLQAPFGDQSLMRNALAYGLWRAMGYWAPRTRHVELFHIDDGEAASSVPCRPFFPATSAQDLIPLSPELGHICGGTRAALRYPRHYVGVYVLTERIERGADRVPIDPMRGNATPGGGFIAKVSRSG